MARASALVLILAGLLGGTRAGAEHEVYYRYVVLGFVTDATGFSLIVSRLGDESAGQRLTQVIGATTLALTARLEPANHTDDRGTRVDLEGPRLGERSSWFRSTLTNALAP